MVLVLFLLLSLIASLLLVFRTTVFFGRAATSRTSTAALDNSYLFASPLQAKADNSEKIRLTVFLLDGRGLGVANIPVTLSRSAKLNVVDTQPITDDSGRAFFDISSSDPGKYPISAQVGIREIPQKINLTFY